MQHSKVLCAPCRVQMQQRSGTTLAAGGGGARDIRLHSGAAAACAFQATSSLLSQPALGAIAFQCTRLLATKARRKGRKARKSTHNHVPLKAMLSLARQAVVKHNIQLQHVRFVG